MPMFRSSSNKSTLSMMQRKATKYQKYLNLSNVFLLITSTILIFTAIVLMKFYHVDKLDFWSAYFKVVPTYMITLGVYTFLVTFFGFAISGSEKRIFIAVYAIFLAIAFLAQLGSIFISLELRTTISQAGITATSVNEDLNKYGSDYSITAKWDELQRYLHCCGGNNYLIGFNDYRSTPIGQNFSVPDSCCHEPHEGCGQGVFRLSHDQVRNKIFTNGCMTLLKDTLETDVLPMMIVYACVGVILALVELITVVLASAYVAQINRRQRREEKTWMINVDDRVGDATDAHALTSMGTVC